MNILIIDNSIEFTGAFKCALSEAELLSDKHQFIFVLNHKSNLRKKVEEKGFKVYQLPMIEIRRSIPLLLLYPFMLLRNTLELRKVVKRNSIDIVQVNDFYNLLGAMLKKFGYKGKLFTYVRFLPSVMPGVLRKLWIKQALKHSDKVIAVSDAVLKQLPDNKKCIRIYDPIKLSEQLPEKEYSERDTIEFLYLSNYIKGKGQDAAIEAFALAYNDNKAIRLTFVGGDMGLEKNISFKKELQSTVDELGLTGKVTFNTFNANVEQAIKDADIVLNFSEAESFSMTCLETAYYGAPIIATRCGGPEEIIVHEETGLLVPVKDIDAMSKAILTLASNYELRKKYAIAGKSYVRNKFSIKEYLSSMYEIIEA